jgi:hypothetical protein
MTVLELIERFARLESQLADEKGDFVLFALFRLEDAPGHWDLMVSAPWLGDEQSAVNYLAGEIKARLGLQDLMNLARIVVIDPDEVALQNLNRLVQVEHGNFVVRDSYFFGLLVKDAHIITSKRPAAPLTIPG